MCTFEGDGTRERDNTSLTANASELAMGRAREDLAAIAAEEFYLSVWG